MPKMALLYGKFLAGLAFILMLTNSLVAEGARGNQLSTASPRDDTIVPEICGRNFIFTYPTSHPSVSHIAYVMITTYSSSPVTVTVSVPGLEFTNTSTISQTNYANITFPSDVMIDRQEEVVNKSILITANEAVCVYGICTSGSTADGFNVLPKRSLGQRYVIASYEPLINYQHPSEFVVTALEETTVVDITFNHDGHRTLQKTLYPYESFQYRDFTHDLTGTLITSNKPISVMSGNECANVPNTIGKCEFLITHLPGTNGFGRYFVLSPFLGRISGYVFRVLAISNNTNVTVSDGTMVQLSEFDFYEGDALTAEIVTTISTTKDVIVTQYAKGLYSDYKPGDPFMLLIPPTTFFSNNVTFPVTNIPSIKTLQTSINIIVRCEENLDISLDGQIEPPWFDRLNSDGEFCVLRKFVEPGLHSVGHPSRNAKFMVVVYGFVWRASYGYLAGYNLQEDESIPVVTEVPPATLLTLPTESIMYPDSAGRHFVFAFPTPTSSMQNVYILITTLTAAATTVSVKVPSVSFQTSVTVSREQHGNVTLPRNTINRLSATSQNTVIVAAQTRVSVFAVCGGSTTIDAFLILPVTTHGSEYVISSYHPLVAYGHASEFTVSSLDTRTEFNITSSHELPQVYTLQPYETRLVRNLERDLTGTRIYSNNPVSVVSGVQCANVPADIGKCEYVVDHLSSVGNFGRQFVLAPFLGRRSGYVFRVMTAGARALIRFSDGRSFNIDPYDYYEVDVVDDDVLIVTSDNPVMVSQFAKGCYSDYLTGDPFMMLIPPTEAYSGSVTFPVTSIKTAETVRAYVNIYIDCRLADNLILDGQVIADWSRLSASEGFCILRNRISEGVHTVWHRDQNARFAVMVYAHAWRAAYGYMAGYNIQSSTIVPTEGSNQKGPNSAGGGPYAKSLSADTTQGLRVRENFLMFMCILAVLLILIVLFALLMFWRDWRKKNNGSFSSISSGVPQTHEDDTKSTEGMAMESMEPEPFTDYDKNPLI
ncbi:uncharacterized protein [Amphiura filiformis]|uniref:uncharacterized protein isoform X2 n=1 Tax=Amphiura filiformis TaxID=82378 RepID=UPI003B21DC19